MKLLFLKIGVLNRLVVIIGMMRFVLVRVFLSWLIWVWCLVFVDLKVNRLLLWKVRL